MTTLTSFAVLPSPFFSVSSSSSGGYGGGGGGGAGGLSLASYVFKKPKYFPNNIKSCSVCQSLRCSWVFCFTCFMLAHPFGPSSSFSSSSGVVSLRKKIEYMCNSSFPTFLIGLLLLLVPESLAQKLVSLVEHPNVILDLFLKKFKFASLLGNEIFWGIFRCDHEESYGKRPPACLPRRPSASCWPAS